MLENEEAKKLSRTYAQIDLRAIRGNLQKEKDKIGDKMLMAIVKADAYGHGAVPVARYVDDVVDSYGVAMIEEAIELRQAGIDKMILILGYTDPVWNEDIVNYDISQAVYSVDMARELGKCAVSLGKTAKIHIKVDTGMGRIGFIPSEESIDEVCEIAKIPGIEIEGIFTHFARADEETSEMAEEPFAKFCDFISGLESRGIKIPVKHAANSASIIQFEKSYLDMVRSGITTYGLYPSELVRKDVIEFEPALQWKSVISHVKNVPTGTTIGYGGTYVAPSDRVIATIPVGYADGYKRDLSNKGRVIINGQYAPIVGRVCMDQFMVDVTDIGDVKVGDEVTLIGRDKDAFISVEEIADMSHSFNYEFICSITNRVPRKYQRE
ncbi:MAG: alanine racemase [Eubacterium sp.]|nr:alanine racemase [Eubacterium sp.]